jgi:hypothetical protein
LLIYSFLNYRKKKKEFDNLEINFVCEKLLQVPLSAMKKFEFSFFFHVHAWSFSFYWRYKIMPRQEEIMGSLKSTLLPFFQFHDEILCC